MKTILCISFFLVAVSAQAQIPGFQHNALTTNKLAGVTVIGDTNIAVGGTLSSDTLNTATLTVTNPLPNLKIIGTNSVGSSDSTNSAKFQNSTASLPAVFDALKFLTNTASTTALANAASNTVTGTGRFVLESAAGGGGMVGTVSNNVVVSGLLAVDGTGTNVIAATSAHVQAAAGNIYQSTNTTVKLTGDTMTGPLFEQISNTSNVITSGIILSNATVTTVGNQTNFSPALRLSGNAWLTGSASNALASWDIYNVPIAGVSSPTANLYFSSSMNLAAPVVGMSLSSIGVLTAANSLISGNDVTASSVGVYKFNTRCQIASSSTTALEFNNSASSARATAQFNIPQITKTTNYQTAVALDSGYYFNNIGASAAQTNWLPAAVANQHYWYYVDAAQIVSIKPFTNTTDVIRWGSALGTTNSDIWSSQVGSMIHLRSPKAGLWVVDSAVGAWTFVAPRSGNSVLVGGTVTVANTTVTANTIVLYSRKTAGGTIGAGGFNYTTTAGTGFTINSEDLAGALSTLDTSTLSWTLIEIPN